MEETGERDSHRGANFRQKDDKARSRPRARHSLPRSRFEPLQRRPDGVHPDAVCRGRVHRALAIPWTMA
jgi:hypothetical protein